MRTDTDIGKKLLNLRFVPLAIGPFPFPQIPFNPSDFISSKEALVGVFDFLGFKKSMLRSNLTEVASDFMNISNTIKSCGADCRKSFEVDGKASNLSPQVIQISDTFIVYNLSREPPNVKHFLWNVHEMMFYAILRGFPLRGALTTGELLIKNDLSLFLGHALQEAFNLEKRQNWSGACIGPSFQHYINEIGLQEAIFPQILPYKIPFKDGASENEEVQPNMALNWIDVFNRIWPDRIVEKFLPFEPGSHEELIAMNTRKFLEFAFDQIDSCKQNWGPTNRRIVLSPAPNLGGSIVRIVDGNYE